MGLTEAGLWGLAGGAIAGLVSLSAAIAAAEFRWPWRFSPDGVWPRLFVAAAGVVIGGVVAAAAHSQMTGPWPALIIGASAPSVIRATLAKVEVTEQKPADGGSGDGTR